MRLSFALLEVTTGIVCFSWLMLLGWESQAREIILGSAWLPNQLPPIFSLFLAFFPQTNIERQNASTGACPATATWSFRPSRHITLYVALLILILSLLNVCSIFLWPEGDVLRLSDQCSTSVSSYARTVWGYFNSKYLH